MVAGCGPPPRRDARRASDPGRRPEGSL